MKKIVISRQFATIATVSAATLVLLTAPHVQGQSVPSRAQNAFGQQRNAPAATNPAPTATGTTANAQAPPLNLLQEPAKDAQVSFAGDRLSIRADNSSLSAILHKVAAQSGMQVEGLAGDERVFGTFGPGSPSDVLADLLNGTAYDVALIGNASYGAPRELILTPSRGGGVARGITMPVQAQGQGSADDSNNDQETQETPPSPPENVPPPAPGNTPAGVRTPQQLFQQLQQMRQAQQQQIPSPDQQSQPPR